MSDGGTAFNAAVAQRVRAHREAKGWTLSAFAEAAGLSTSQLSRLETGQNEWTAARLYTVAAALGVPVSDLVGYDNEPGTVRVAVSPDEVRVLRAFRSGSLTKFWRVALEMWEARHGKG